MRRWTVAGMAMAATLALASPAAAGTYDVVSCGAPGAGGVNRAWTSRVDDPASAEVATCGRALFGGSSAQPSRTAPFFTGAHWTFDAPSGTRITRLVAWRYGRHFGNGWQVTARDHTANIIGGPFTGETCNIPSGQIGCEFGSNTGVGKASRAQYSLDTTQVFYSAACGGTSGCPTSNNSGTRFAEFHLFGTAVTLREDTAPGLTVGGPLFADGWRRPGDSQELTYSASDGVGIRRVALTGAGAAARNHACDYTRPVPCARASGRLTPAPGLGEGVHALTVTAEDAAGNRRAVARTVRIDGTPPNARVAVARGRNILVDVTDNVSGVARGEIHVRDTSRDPFRSLPTTLEGGRLRARMDRGPASRSTPATRAPCGSGSGEGRPGRCRPDPLRPAGAR